MYFCKMTSLLHLRFSKSFWSQWYQSYVGHYLDDFFLLGDNFEDCLKAVKDTTQLLSKLGLQIRLQKKQFLYLQKESSN